MTDSPRYAPVSTVPVSTRCRQDNGCVSSFEAQSNSLQLLQERECMCFTSTSVHATPLSSVLVANMMPLCGHRWQTPLAMDVLANTPSFVSQFPWPVPWRHLPGSTLPILVADATHAYGQHCQASWPIQRMFIDSTASLVASLC